MRVVHIISSLGHGGAERQVLNLARESHRVGEKAWVVALCGEIPNWPGYEAVLNDYTLALGLRRRNSPLTVLRLALWLRSIKPDVVQTHLVGGGLYGRIAAWLARVPVIIATEHGRTGWKGVGMRSWERFAQKHTAIRIAVSEEIRQLRRQHEGTSDSGIIVIPNGVVVPEPEDCATDRVRFRAKWGIPENARLAGYLGRWIELKNIPLIIEAFARIAREQPDFWLAVIGEGNSRAAIEAARKAAGDVADRIRLIGFEPEADRAMSALDVFVMFSEREGLPLSLLEAMAASVPVISSAVGEIPTVLSHGGGITVPKGNTIQLGKELGRLMHDRELATVTGHAARRNILERYSVQVSYQQHRALYQRLRNETT
jgi:glycosyltransferase involved in cell wall biosynthesis